MNTSIIGKNIKRLRDERGITQQQLAEILGVSFQTVSKWECNTTSPDISILPEIADFFEISIDSLFTLSRNPFKNTADRLAFKYGCDIEKSDVFDQADAEFRKIFGAGEYDHVDLKNYSYLNKCRMKYYMKKTEKYYLDAIAEGEKIKDEPYYRTLTEYMLFLSELGRAQERVKIHEQMLEQDPDTVFNYICLMFAYGQTDNHTKIRNVCENALAKFPDNAELYSFMAGMHKKDGNYDEAIACWNKAWSLGPDYASDLYALAFHYRDNNQPEKAIEIFGQILDWLDEKGFRDGMKFVKGEIRKIRCNTET